MRIDRQSPKFILQLALSIAVTNDSRVDQVVDKEFYEWKLVYEYISIILHRDYVFRAADKKPEVAYPYVARLL